MYLRFEQREDGRFQAISSLIDFEDRFDRYLDEQALNYIANWRTNIA